VSDPKQPETMTPAQMRDLADRLERQAQAQLARAKQLRGAADTIEAIRAMPAEQATNPLIARNEYGTIDSMSSTEIVAPVKKRRGPPSEGPMTDLARDLGFASMAELAAALKEKDSNVRAWNHRGVPEAAKAKIERLRAKRTKRA
jgi:hypothetical protein